MKHKLSLHIPDTMDDWSLTIQDTSVYADLIPITCPTLQILAPGFIKAVTITDTTMPNPLGPYFNRTFTACHLELQTEACGTKYECLPDGIYTIRYSVSPNDVVYVEYNHLRMVKALTKWNTKLCELEVAPCDPTTEKKAKLDELMQIKSYLEAAKNMVEFCHKADKGMDLYNYALKRLNKLDCQTC
jgi:hypothetical protein